MRLVHSAALAVAALLLASAASAQGLGAAAAREREKRKAQPEKPAKVYTEDDIGRSMAPVSSTQELPATAADAAAQKPAAEGGTAAGGDAQKDPEAEAAEAHAKAEADWHKRLDQARQEEASLTELASRVQLALNDTSNLYNPGRQSNVTLLEDTQKKLADVKTRIADLEAEGRRSDYR